MISCAFSTIPIIFPPFNSQNFYLLVYYKMSLLLSYIQLLQHFKAFFTLFLAIKFDKSLKLTFPGHTEAFNLYEP